MKKTYKIKLPKGANISAVETNDDNGVLEVTVDFEKKYVPKDGDVVYAQWDGNRSGYKWIFIYKKALTDPYKRCDVYAYLGIERDGKTVSELHFDDHCTSQELLRPATETEKQRLFDALAKQGKRWNAEKKCIEDLPRWRAGCNKTYLYITSQCYIIGERESNACIDSYRYAIGNYFRTREAAEKVASQIRDIFKNSKAE